MWVQQIGPDLFCCADCGHDTKLIGERYMLRESVWLYVITGRWAYMLCIGCVEARLGRKLTRYDFIECPLNRSFGLHSLRLADRLTR